ncbi:LAFA_0G16776g1_1 [Lachancea sp. 'fantastica']|nr:LAFA_0G16776g1_1 [Lachancea sp. 'fantastica']
MSSQVENSELREYALRNRLRERTGSIFKSRHESNMRRSQGISHEQILISSSPTSLSQIAKGLDGDILGFSRHRIVDNIMVLGATGLTGSLIVANLTQPWAYLNSTNDIQRKLDNLSPSTEQLDKNNHFFKRTKQPLCNVLTRKKTVEITKNLFCFARKPIEQGTVASLGEHNSAWEHSVHYRGSTLLCRYDNFECDGPVVSMGYLELPNSQQQKEKSAIEMHVQQYSYRLKYENSQDEHGQNCRHTLTVELKLNVVSLIEKESWKWPELFKSLFGEEPTTASVVTKKLEQTMLWNFPSLKQVSTIISALGSSDHEQRTAKISRSFVDHDLILQMIQVFSQSKDASTQKKAIVITSFNNLFLTSFSDYFRTKLSLEQDLATRVPGLDKLVILRPGPLVGSHTLYNTANSSSFQETKPSLIPNTIFAIYCLKRSCLERKIRFARDLSRYGLKLKLGEIMARIAYNRSCSPLIGYAVPAYKVAYVAVLKALRSMDSDSFVEVIKSDQIDHLT